MPATARRKCQSGAPKRSPSRSAIGRAPIAITSRMIPPTPVAAPWKGSTALGWLCDSTLNAHASPPPTSTAPAFSPGPTTTCGPLLGSVRSSFFEYLYAQCSLHRSEYIASSSAFGAPPCFSHTSSYSSRVRPSARASASLGNYRPHRRAHRLEDQQPVRGGPCQLAHRMLGVRHEAKHVAR